MNEQELAVTNNLDAVIMEKVVVNGDLSLLKPEQRVAYYNKVCQSVGLNPLTKPFCYIQLNGKLQLYALKDASEQLRKINGISIDKPTFEYVDDLIIVSVNAIDRTGRKDSDAGVVTIGTLKGDNKANAIMKAITKAKRRVTLSISGLGWLDETEIETIPNAVLVDVDDTGEVKKSQPTITVIDPGQSPSPSNENGHKPLAEAIIAEGGVPTANDQPKAEYKGKTAKLHQNTYPLLWTGKLIQVFVTSGKLNVPHLDGILQKLNLSFDTDIDTVISAVNDYAKENAQKEN